MRPIPESKLEAAVLATSELKEAHGAPIHIGDPGKCFSCFTTYALLSIKMAEGGAMTSGRNKIPALAFSCFNPF